MGFQSMHLQLAMGLSGQNAITGQGASLFAFPLPVRFFPQCSTSSSQLKYHLVSEALLWPSV